MSYIDLLVLPMPATSMDACKKAAKKAAKARVKREGDTNQVAPRTKCPPPGISPPQRRVSRELRD